MPGNDLCSSGFHIDTLNGDVGSDNPDDDHHDARIAIDVVG